MRINPMRPAILSPIILSITLWLAPTIPAHSAAPEVLVTMKPLHSLVSGLLQDITEPRLLIDGYQSPHTFQLRPGDLHKIDRADIIIWIGPGMETSMQRIIDKQTDKIVIQLAADDHHQHAHDHLHEDPHRWLDPHTALHDMQRIGRLLSRHLPAHADTMEQNLTHLTQRLQRLDEHIRTRFAEPQTIPALLYHDAWRHFLRRYRLQTHGIINPHAHTRPGARHLHAIAQTINRRQTRCLMAEPQFRSRQVASLQARHKLQIITLDPLGADLPATADAYFTLMQRIAAAFAECR